MARSPDLLSVRRRPCVLNFFIKPRLRGCYVRRNLTAFELGVLSSPNRRQLYWIICDQSKHRWSGI